MSETLKHIKCIQNDADTISKIIQQVWKLKVDRGGLPGGNDLVMIHSNTPDILIASYAQSILNHLKREDVCRMLNG